jgi:hypothetical protein
VVGDEVQRDVVGGLQRAMTELTNDELVVSPASSPAPIGVVASMSRMALAVIS